MFAFLLQAVLISLSGVMAPGPMTAAAIESGTRRWHAGIFLALGHAIVKIPLIIILVLAWATSSRNLTCRSVSAWPVGPFSFSWACKCC